MRVVEPLVSGWSARLGLDFELQDGRTVLAGKRFEGPLVVQKPLYPEGEGVCHAIVVHPPAGIAGGDDLAIEANCGAEASALLTTPGAGKWYRSAGPWARQRLDFEVAGTMEWLPRETIVFDGALAAMTCRVALEGDAKYVGWEVLCLGRTGSGERFGRGEIRLETMITRDGRALWLERGRIEAGGALMRSPAGLGGHSVLGTFLAAADRLEPGSLPGWRAAAGESLALTLLPGLLVARYLGDSSEEALERFAGLWQELRPSVLGREAVRPRIWST